MSLDTAKKRGAAMGMSLPFRIWTAVPSGGFDSSDMIGLMWYGASITPAIVANFNKICLFNESSSQPTLSSEFSLLPAISGESLQQSSLTSESIVECP